MARSTASPTQEHLPIAGIVDGTVIMTDGSLRAVLKLEPINFDLKSETEQNAIIYAYQGFLNSLDFPIQIVVQSKKLDLEQYLIRLEKSQKTVTNDLLRIQIEDYVGFVRRLISVANIMSKRFYVVVSYAPISKSAGFAQISNIFHRQPTGPIMDEAEFAHYRTEVHNRANIIAGGLGRLSIKSTLLETQQLIELYYGIYNPDVVSEERLTDVDTLNSNIVSGIDAPQDAPAAPAVETPPTGFIVQPPQSVTQEDLSGHVMDTPLPDEIVTPPAPVVAPVPIPTPIAPTGPVAEVPTQPLPGVPAQILQPGTAPQPPPQNNGIPPISTPL